MKQKNKIYLFTKNFQTKQIVMSFLRELPGTNCNIGIASEHTMINLTTFKTNRHL